MTNWIQKLWCYLLVQRAGSSRCQTFIRFNSFGHKLHITVSFYNIFIIIYSMPASCSLRIFSPSYAAGFDISHFREWIRCYSISSGQLEFKTQRHKRVKLAKVPLIHACQPNYSRCPIGQIYERQNMFRRNRVSGVWLKCFNTNKAASFLN
jgi:hypothetical protein